MSEIEQIIGQPEAAFRQGALEEIIALQQPRPTTCPRCGGKLESKGKRTRQIVTVRGETTLERTYYQCQGCGQRYFPPG